MKLTRYIFPFLFLVSVTSACIIGFDTEDKANKFHCTTDDDCESGFECKKDKEGSGGLFCKKQAPGEELCPDEDGDGYGVGDDRVNCTLCKTQSKCEEDFNDDDDAIYPNAPEACDNKDNDNDGTVDNINTPCKTANDCAQVDQAVSPGVSVLCDPQSKTCVARMKTTICFGAGAPEPCPCNDSPLTCTAGVFPAVPEFCQ